MYGAFLRVASDLSLGTPLESIKCRVTGTGETPVQATKDIINEGGIWALWTGTPSRTIEGSLLGAIYLLGATVTKNQVKALGGSPTLAALCGGLVGGVAQSVVMTPAGSYVRETSFHPVDLYTNSIISRSLHQEWSLLLSI